jgi:hypothetical protein
VPDDTDAAVSLGGDGLEGAGERLVDGVELVVPGHLLDDGSGIDFEDDEVLNEVEEASPSVVRQGMNRSQPAVRVPMRAVMPSLATRQTLYVISVGSCSL